MPIRVCVCVLCVVLRLRVCVCVCCVCGLCVCLCSVSVFACARLYIKLSIYAELPLVCPAACAPTVGTLRVPRQCAFT